MCILRMMPMGNGFVVRVSSYVLNNCYLCVLGRGEQDLGRPVPAGGHVLGERRVGALLALVRLVRQ